MISSNNFQLLPSPQQLQTICKAIAVLDAIICPEWEYRYYSYNCQWDDGEEFFEMRNGEGDQMLILFQSDACVINGYAYEFEQPDKTALTSGLPARFESFIFEEPVQSIGSTFCLWTKGSGWESAGLPQREDGSEEMMRIFSGGSQTYIDWANEYFKGSYLESGLPMDTVSAIYSGEPLTKAMVLSIVKDVEDWELLKADLDEIDYPYVL